MWRQALFGARTRAVQEDVALPEAEPAAAATPQEPAPATHPFIFPDEFEDERDGRPRVPWRLPGGNGALVALGALAGAAMTLGALRLFTEPSPAPWPAAVDAAAASPPPARAQLDPLADSLVLALEAFQVRAEFFGRHQMTCPDLARGLILLEERWTAYNVARGRQQAVLDSTAATSDRALSARVEDATRRFERSGCPRP